MRIDDSEIRINEQHQMVLSALIDEAKTAQEIQNDTTIARSTVYKVLQDLQDLGKVRNVTPGRLRNAKYGLGSGTGPNRIIPEMIYEGKSYKAPFFLQVEEDVVTTPFKRLFLGLARILKTAERLNEGATLEQTEIVLRKVKVDLIKARAEFTALADLANQILEEPKYWNPIYLERFHKDEAWKPKFHDRIISKYTKDDSIA